MAIWDCPFPHPNHTNHTNQHRLPRTEERGMEEKQASVKKSEIVAKVRRFREDIDGLLFQLEQDPMSASPGPLGQTSRIVHMKLAEARMWSGKILGYLGDSLPPQYQNQSQARIDAAEKKAAE